MMDWSRLTPRFFELLDRPYMVQRVVLVWVVGTFTYALWWMFDYASTSPRPGAEVAMIIGAINAPLCFLMGAMMSFWREIRGLPATPPVTPPPTP